MTTPHDAHQRALLEITRRHFLEAGATGLGAAALASLLGCTPTRSAREPLAALQIDDPVAARAPHFPATAKRVIFLHMAGAPSQLEMFDHKPMLTK